MSAAEGTERARVAALADGTAAADPLAIVQAITSAEAGIRNRGLEHLVRTASTSDLLHSCEALDAFRRRADNLYERVRALFLLHALHRYHLAPAQSNDPGRPAAGSIPVDAHEHLLNRRYHEAIDRLLEIGRGDGVTATVSSALAEAYIGLGFETLARQVRHSVRSVEGNRWMFRMGHPADHPLRVRPELMQPIEPAAGRYPILCEETPVRLDLTHSGWSDIFFLGMDFPEGARVLNISVDLAVNGRDPTPAPPISTRFRVLDEPVLRLVSIDLDAHAEITTLEEVFDFARDYLGLLKAAVIAAGIVPAALEGSEQSLPALMSRLLARGGEFSLAGRGPGDEGPGTAEAEGRRPRGMEIVSRVNGIPKGSRLAVSTNLLASLIALLMRATGQTQCLTGPLAEHERRTVAARAILGEWLGGSGGGWQDSGGIWPGIKRIGGVPAAAGDPEFRVSRGRLLPAHVVFDRNAVSEQVRSRLQNSLVLVHGGMAQDVGPILEMVTERYLLRSEPAWTARAEAIGIFDRIESALREGNIDTLADLTTRNFFGPICTIIPWASNAYTEHLIESCRQHFGDRFLGFLMLGGMSGGGMGFFFRPEAQAEGRAFLSQCMRDAKQRLKSAIPFAMDPVIYDFRVNEHGSVAHLRSSTDDARMPDGYYALLIPGWLRQDGRNLPPLARRELEQFASLYHAGDAHADAGAGVASTLTTAVLDRLLPRMDAHTAARSELQSLLDAHGFDRQQHEKIRADLRSGRIGLARNRMHPRTFVEDIDSGLVVDARGPLDDAFEVAGRQALAAGEVAVVTLAGGIGTRWSHGAGVVKALHPFVRLGGAWRSFLDLHLAKSRLIGRQVGISIPHIITTSHLTHSAIAAWASDVRRDAGPSDPGEPEIIISEGRAVGLRLVPMVRDLRYAWEEMPQQLLDERQQRVRESVRQALLNWARSAGEGADYIDNTPRQCLHPVGHWYEVPNLLRNGVLRDLLTHRPQLRHLLLHNVDTTGVNLRSDLLGLHVARATTFTVEVIARWIEDRGGGLARVDGRPRLVEGLALPREEMESLLSFYNTATMWIDIDQLLRVFGLNRSDLDDSERVDHAVRGVADRMPTYVAIKDVKKRWGHGQEDVYPVAQFEKLWTDMTALPEVACTWVAVPRRRGQQLKDIAQRDPWYRDGSAAFAASLCAWPERQSPVT